MLRMTGYHKKIINGEQGSDLNNNMTEYWVQDPMGWGRVLYLKK